MELDAAFLAHPQEERECLSPLLGKMHIGISVVDPEQPDFLHPHPHRHRKGHRAAVAEDEIEADELPDFLKRVGNRGGVFRIFLGRVDRDVFLYGPRREPPMPVRNALNPRRKVSKRETTITIESNRASIDRPYLFGPGLTEIDEHFPDIRLMRGAKPKEDDGVRHGLEPQRPQLFTSGHYALSVMAVLF